MGALRHRWPLAPSFLASSRSAVVIPTRLGYVASMDQRLATVRQCLPAVFREVPSDLTVADPADLSSEDEETGRDGRGPFLVCAQCRFRVTRPAWRIEVAGKRAHVVFNPHGILFEIGCFSAAPGVTAEGPASPEFTWFPGHAWEVAYCRGCGAHLGWRYVSEGGSVFFGLIEDRLGPDEGEEDGNRE